MIFFFLGYFENGIIFIYPQMHIRRMNDLSLKPQEIENL